MYGRDNGFGRKPPVNVGDELDVRIEAVGEKGDGVAKKDGFVLFIPNVKEGDEVRVKVSRVLRKVGFAEMIGKSQGSIGDSAPQQQKLEEKPVQEAELDYDESKDSEDFGEDSSYQEQDQESESEEDEIDLETVDSEDKETSDDDFASQEDLEDESLEEDEDEKKD